MAEVKHFIDQSSIQQDGDIIKGILDDVMAKLEKIKTIKVDLKGFGSFASATQAAKDLEKTQNELIKATEKLATTNAKLLKAKEAQLRVDTQQVKLDAEKAKSANNLAKEQAKLLAQSEKEVKQLEKNNNAYTQLIEKQKQAGAASLKRGAELLKEAKGNDQMFVSLLKTDKEYLAASKSAKTFNDQLMLLEQNIGRNQRNVGNYASAYNGLSRQFGLIANELPSLTISVQQFALALSNNLPMAAEEIRNAQREIKELQAAGKSAPTLFARITDSIFSFQVGISIVVTLLVAFMPKIIEFFKELKNGKQTIIELNEEQKKFADLLSDEKVKLDNLFAIATKSNLPLVQRKEAIRQLRESYGAYLKDFSDEAIMAGEATDAYNKLAIAIIKVARARAAEEIQKDNQKKILENEGKIAKLREKAQQDAKNAKGFKVFDEKRVEIVTIADVISGVYKKAREDVSSIRKETQGLIDDNNRLAKVVLDNQIDPLTTDEPSGGKGGRKPGGKDPYDFMKDEVAAKREGILLLLADEAEYQKKVADDENQLYEVRIKAAENFYNIQKVIAKTNRDFELEDLKKKQAELGLSDGQVKEQRKLINDKYDRQEIKSTTDHQKDITKITIDNLKQREAFEQDVFNRKLRGLDDDFQKEKAQLEAQRDEELIQLNKLAELTNMSEEERKAKELEIVVRYNRLILEAELKKIKALIDLEDDPVKKAQLFAKAKNLELAISNLTTDGKIKNLKKEAEEEQKLANLKKKLQEELLNLTKAVVLGRFDAAKNSIQGEIEALDEKKRKEMELVQATVTNEQEKAARLTNIEKKAQVEKERLEFRKRQLDIQRAKWEKAFTVASIIQLTAKAVVAALGSVPYTPANIALATLTGAIGAVQVATALAQPIPRFKEGKGQYDQYEGPAWVGDGGKSEMIFRKDGGVEKTPSTPVLTYVGKDDIIHPDADALLNSAFAKQGAVYNYKINDNGFVDMTSTLSHKLDMVAATIQNKREWNVNLNNGKPSIISKDGSRYKKYLNDNLQFGR